MKYSQTRGRGGGGGEDDGGAAAGSHVSSLNKSTILFQLEQHNHELEIKNEVLTDQVEILRERLQALPAFAAKEILRQSQQVGTCLQILHWLKPFG